MVSNNNQNKFTLLIVDDDPITRQVLATQLSSPNYTIVQAVSRADVLTRLQDGLKPDIILLAMMIPNQNSYEITQTLRDTWRADKLPIILLTSNTNFTDLVAELEAGTKDSLTQPLSTAELLACVKTHLHRQQLLESAKHEQEQQRVASLEANFRNLAANVPGVIYQWYERNNGERGFHYISPRCEDLYGVKAADWQRNWQLLPLHPDDLPRWYQTFQQALANKQDFSFEGRFLLPSGEVKWWRSLSKPVQINDEEIVFNGIIIDIMAQKQLEATLREKEQRLEDAQRMALLGSWVWDIKTGTVYRSAQDCHNYGISSDNYIPTYEAFLAPVHPDDKPIIDAMVETCIIEGQTTSQEFRVIWPDGQIRTMRSQTELEFDESGTPIRLKGFSQDITERKHAVETLQQRTLELAMINRVAEIFSATLELPQVLELILEEVQHLLGITVTSLWLKIPDTNELVCQHARGHNNDVVIGWRLPLGQGFTGRSAQTGKTLLVPDTRVDERHFKGVDQKTGIELRSILCVPLITKGEMIGVLNLADTKPGRFTEDDTKLLESIASSAANAIENARLYTLSQQELTERKRAEAQIQHQNIELQAKNAQLERLTQELAQAQQEKLFQLNKAYERFVPRQFLSLLDKQSVLDVQLGDQVEKEMTILFSDIRGFTTLSEQMSPQDVFDFVNNYMGQMEPIIMAHGGVIDKYIGDAIMALFPNSADDAIRGSIAMLKMLSNYNNLLQRAGLPQIAIGIGLNTGPLMLGTVGGQNRMDGTVISDAVNIASRVQDLTKVYHTPLLITEQTYLKLADPLQYHLRVLDVAKVKGKSAVVTIYEIYDADSPESVILKDKTRDDFEVGFVLYHSGEAQDARLLFENVLHVNGHDKVAQVYLERCNNLLSAILPSASTILIVDDVLENVSVLFEVLTNNNFEVLVADSGEATLQVIQYEKPDLILLDVMMPGIDGFETCKRLKANLETQDIPIIFMTALAETVNKVKGFELGAVDYITKPFEHEEVLARIRAQLNIRHLQKQLQAKNIELERHNLELHDRLENFHPGGRF
jgi:PAS domain S-box-containing protein